MLNAKNISKNIGGQQILDMIDIDLNPGEITVLIGPSGSGKSTLLKCLSLLDPPSSGQVSLDAETFGFPGSANKNLDHIYPSLTVVFQQFHLWPHLKVDENLRLPISSGILWQQSNFERLIQRFDIEKQLNKYPFELSIGQRQRVALVRALLLEPKYLLLDEVTSALDVRQIENVLITLRELREKGTGILLATHLIGFARQLADTVIFLDGGGVAERGGREILSLPATPLLKSFLSFNEYAD